MESDLENDRVWSDALASYQMIRSARETGDARDSGRRDCAGLSPLLRDTPTLVI